MKDLIVLQQDEKDCGAACLLSLIKYYGGYVPLELIKYDTLTNNNGTNFYNMKIAANSYGFDVIGLKTYIDNIPCIAQICENGLYHFVVIYKIISDYVICMDPSIGTRKIKLEKFNILFNNNILKLNPIQKIAYYKESKYLINVIREFIRINIFYTLLSFASVLLITICSIISTYLLNIVLSSKKIIILFIIIIIFKVIFEFINNYLSSKLKNKFDTNLIKNYLNQTFNLPYKYLYLKSSGDIINRVNDINLIASFIGEEIPNILINVLFLLSSWIILLNINHILTIILLILFFISLLLSNFLSKNIATKYINKVISDNSFTNRLNEYLNKILTIKNLNKTSYYYDKLKSDINAKYNANSKIDKAMITYNLFTQIYNTISFALIITLNYKNEVINLFTYLFFYDFYKNSTNYFLNLMTIKQFIKDIFIRINSVYFINEVEKGNKKFTNGNITINNLNYKISINNIINNLSFIINKGDKVNIIGKNGCGKSTLLNIIFGNIDNYKGNIFIASTNFKDIDNIDLKENIAYISQESNLFEDTILNNIILDRKYDKKKLNQIIKILNLDKVIKNKELGYNSIIKNNLSGGEKQKIMLARSLYGDAKIYLFDEAFSQINIKERKRIINYINDYYKDKTIIYVNHFKDDIKYDKVLKM